MVTSMCAPLVKANGIVPLTIGVVSVVVCEVTPTTELRLFDELTSNWNEDKRWQPEWLARSP